MDASTVDAGKATRSRLDYLLPLVLVGYLVAYFVAWLVAEGSARTWVLDILNAVGPLPAAILCTILVRKAANRRLAVFWGLLAAAMVCSVLAEGIWAIYELALGKMGPFPSAADPFWLLAYPLQFAAIISLVSFKASGRLAATAVAGAAVFVALVAGTMMALFIMLPSVDSEATTLSNLVTILYPAGDVLLLSALGIIAVLPTQRQRLMPKGMLCIAAAFVVNVVADIVYAAQEVQGTYATGSWVDLLWPLGYTLMAAAAAWQFMRPRRSRIM